MLPLIRMTAPGAKPILVADDDPDILELVCLRLERVGHSTVRAGDGEEAVRLAGETTPKMCILDIVMPGVSGLDVVRELRAAPPTAGVPILLLSASVQDADVQRGLELGADDYLRKPFETQQLLGRVADLLSDGREPSLDGG
jgi:DNA-binding response OmpR family regulator